MDVTQATLSRDLRDLGLARVPDRGRGALRPAGNARRDDDKPLLGNLLPQLFSRIDGVGELIVLHTVRSGAQPIAEAIDQEGSTEVLGTIAGDDTILIVRRSAERPAWRSPPACSSSPAGAERADIASRRCRRT